MPGETAQGSGNAHDERHPRLALQLAFIDALRTLSDPIEVQNAAMRLVAQHPGVASAYFFEVDRDGDTLTFSTGYGIGAARLPKRFRITDFGEFVSSSYAAGRTPAFNDFAIDPRLTDAEMVSFRAISTRSGVGVPLLKFNRLVAWLGVHDAKPRRWREVELFLLEDVGRISGSGRGHLSSRPGSRRRFATARSGTGPNWRDGSRCGLQSSRRATTCSRLRWTPRRT